VRGVADVLVAVVALLHAYFLVLEMFLWTKPQGRKAFGLTAEFAAETKVLAGHQGPYHGCRAAWLVWGPVAGDELREPVLVFFLLCVVVAGGFGAATVSRRILVVQALPAALALVAVLISG